MTTFSSFSFRIIKISPYIIFFLNLWQDFGDPLRAVPGGRCPPAPPLATPLPVMYALVSFSGKKYDKKDHFSQSFKMSTSIHKNNPAFGCFNCFAKTLLSCVF